MIIIKHENILNFIVKFEVEIKQGLESKFFNYLFSTFFLSLYSQLQISKRTEKSLRSINLAHSKIYFAY